MKEKAEECSVGWWLLREDVGNIKDKDIEEKQ